MFRIGKIIMKSSGPIETPSINNGNPIMFFAIEDHKTFYWVQYDWGVKHLPDLGRIVYFYEGDTPVMETVGSSKFVWFLPAKDLKVIPEGRKSTKLVKDLRYRHN